MTTPGMDEQQPEPEPEEILQFEEGADPTVSVAVEGPVRTQELPRKSAGIRGVTVKDGPPTLLLRADPHRARAVIIPSGAPLLIAGSRQEIQGGQPGQLPDGQQLEFCARDELWGQSLGVSSITVTVIQERWAESP